MPGLGVAEGPQLVGLDALARQVAEGGVLIAAGGFAEIAQELEHGHLCCAGRPAGGVDAHAFDEASDDLCSSGGAQPVHTGQDA
ncbi:MAG TPA: hypothetical protein VES62_07610 [Thermoleophilaceae bacterium]|nr:hypothetical protein [Thermoleophilaceae bacterium]